MPLLLLFQFFCHYQSSYMFRNSDPCKIGCWFFSLRGRSEQLLLERCMIFFPVQIILHRAILWCVILLLFKGNNVFKRLYLHTVFFYLLLVNAFLAISTVHIRFIISASENDKAS